MEGLGISQMVPVEKIELDRSNPRIRKFLEIYVGDPTPEQIFLALGAGNDDEGQNQSAPTFQKLKQSIITNRGIIQPVIVNRRNNGTLVCIDGNTRVALYKDFLKRATPGAWNEIQAIVYDGIDDVAVHAIRLQAHLVGPRPWDPYSKAKYLYDLQHNKLLPFNAIVDFCGGHQSEVAIFIEAYSDMETYYRPLIENDSDFDTTRFSGFVELQKPGVKAAIAKTGHDLEEFATWIRDGKISPLRTVRILPKILRDAKAHEIFLKNDARAAEAVLHNPEADKYLQNADLGVIARALIEKLESLPYNKFKALRSDPTSETVEVLSEARDSLSKLLIDLA